MESKQLTNAINKHLFVPIPEDLAGHLQEVVVNHVSGMTADLVTNYANAVFRNLVDWKFKNTVQTKYKEQFGGTLTLPNIVYLILEGYALRQMVESDTFDSRQKAKFSLIVKNCAVIRKGSWDGIVCSKWLIEIYG